MQYSSYQTRRLKFLDLFGNKLLWLQSLLSDLLLDGPGMRADSKVVLDYLPGNTGDVRWLPSKHIDIRPQEGNKHAFLFVIEGGTDNEGTINVSQPAGTFFTVGTVALGLLLLELSGNPSTGAA